MPDNSAEIARLQALLATGLKAMSVPGESATFDPESIERQIAALRDTDTSTIPRKRPRMASINLGGCK